MNNSIIPLRFTFIIFFIFMTDLSQFFIVGKVFSPFLISSYCSLLVQNPQQKRLFFVMALVCLESFCFYTYSLLPLLYLIPTHYLAFYFKKNLYPSPLHGITYTLLCILVHIYCIESLQGPVALSADYIVSKIGLTLLLEIFLSFSIKWWNKPIQN